MSGAAGVPQTKRRRETQYEKGWREASERWTELGVTAMGAQDGAFQIELHAAQELLLIWASAMAKVVGDAPNYVEMDVQHRANAERYTLRLQKRSGRTPHEMRQQAEAERDELVQLIREFGDRNVIAALEAHLGSKS